MSDDFDWKKIAVAAGKVVAGVGKVAAGATGGPAAAQGVADAETGIYGALDGFGVQVPGAAEAGPAAKEPPQVTPAAKEVSPKAAQAIPGVSPPAPKVTPQLSAPSLVATPLGTAALDMQTLAPERTPRSPPMRTEVTPSVAVQPQKVSPEMSPAVPPDAPSRGRSRATKPDWRSPWRSTDCPSRSAIPRRRPAGPLRPSRPTPAPGRHRGDGRSANAHGRVLHARADGDIIEFHWSNFGCEGRDRRLLAHDTAYGNDTERTIAIGRTLENEIQLGPRILCELRIALAFRFQGGGAALSRSGNRLAVHMISHITCGGRLDFRLRTTRRRGRRSGLEPATEIRVTHR